MKLMTQYDYRMVDLPDDGMNIILVQLESQKEFKFYLRGNHNFKVMASHMDSLTDSLCEQWFQADLTPEELKERQKARKAAARKEREELELKAQAQKLESDRLKAEEKAKKKARSTSKT